MSPSRLDLGGLSVTPILAGRFRLDGGAMYGVVPRPLWEPLTPPDERHRIAMACHSLLVEDQAGHRLLVDAGLGQRFDARSREIFAVDPATTLGGSLAGAGVEAEGITHVLFTHLHFDHVAGALVAAGPDDVRPLFPAATHLVQGGEIDDALAGRSIMRSSYRRDDLDALRHTVDLHALDGDGDVLPGVSVEVTGGHTARHQAVILHGRRQTVAFPGDLLPTRHHLRPYWIMAYDMFPHDTLAAKTAFLRRALAEDWIIAWDHDPEATFSRLRQEDDRIVAVPLEREPTR